jgi:hypothetical protein
VVVTDLTRSVQKHIDRFRDQIHSVNRLISPDSKPRIKVLSVESMPFWYGSGQIWTDRKGSGWIMTDPGRTLAYWTDPANSGSILIKIWQSNPVLYFCPKKPFIQSLVITMIDQRRVCVQKFRLGLNSRYLYR